MKLLRRLFSIGVVALCQFPSHVALAADAIAMQSGVIRIEDEHFTLRLSEPYRFINAADTVRILVDHWGNPPAQVAEQNPLGMIVDKNFFIEGATTGVVVTASHDGHVSDKDAQRLDGNGLLQVIRRDYGKRNKERKAIGADPVTALEWAIEPQYDRDDHVLYWAKAISFGKKAPKTLNYSVRVLGRENAIHFNAVSGMDRLPEVRAITDDVLASAAFDSGFRYQDFNGRYHRAADYGISGLIAGASAVRSGFLQNLWATAVSLSPSVALALVVGFAVAMSRLLAGGRRRLPEF